MTYEREAEIFEDRRDAGRRLAAEMQEYRGCGGVVIGLAKGGVPVAAEIAELLELDFGVIVANELCSGGAELALGAVSEMGGVWIDTQAVRQLGVDPPALESEIAGRKEEVERVASRYRKGGTLGDVSGRTVILAVDGIVTGYRVLAALKGLRRPKPALLVVATPLALPDSLWRVSKEADRAICLATPAHFDAVGAHYRGFETLSDEDMSNYLQKMGSRHAQLG